MANAIRALSMDAVERAKSGHPGMPMGMADVATVLFANHLRFNPKTPNWHNRDRFILSAGHGSMLLYSLLYLTGYEDISIDDLKNFRQLHAKTAGHPEYGHLAGIETTTGPLGQGLGNAVGMALAERLQHERFGSDVNHHTYVIVGDGCLMEGISQEAISFAGHLKLNKLIVLFDDNGISIDGAVSLSSSEDQIARFKACGWESFSIDGHNYSEIDAAITRAKSSDRPVMIACKTTIAYGAPTKAGSSASHGSPLGAEEIKGAKEQLGWNYPPFEIPADIIAMWRNITPTAMKLVSGELKRLLERKLPDNFAAKIQDFKKELIAKQPKEATRQSSGNVLEMLASFIPELIGGSADLTGSNNTKTKAQTGINRDDFSGSYIYYGIREHGMAAIMNGMALYGGIIPYGGTFLVFSDYCRPSIRLSALMQQRVIYVMTHDSIGLGEDGPTHQPVEHLAALRVIPGLQVFRPCDAVETLESWQIALESQDKPSLLALTRQALPSLRKEYSQENLSAKGGYIISEQANAISTIVATGSEVHLAIKAQTKLAQEEIAVNVVSMPSVELFLSQSKEYQQSVLKGGYILAVEAASSMGWERVADDFIGMISFGASAPAEELYEYFGITIEKIIEKIRHNR